ncbi:DUF4231 domain-containing protein [Nonomuraea angiospora]
MTNTDLSDSPETLDLDKEIERHEHDLRKWRLIYRAGICFVGLLAFTVFALIVTSIVTRDSTWLGWIVIVMLGAAFPGPWLFELPELRDRLLRMRQKILDLKHLRRERIAQITNTPRTKHFRYKESLVDLVGYYKLLGNRYRRIHNLLQLLTILGSVITSTLVAAAGDFAWGRWLGSIAALTLGVSAGVSNYFKLNEKSAALQKAADEIEEESRAVNLGIGEYKDMQDNEALALFVERVEKIRIEQAARKRDLDQLSDQISFDNSVQR